MKRHLSGVPQNTQQEMLPVSLESLLREGIPRDAAGQTNRPRLSSGDSQPSGSRSPSSKPSDTPMSLVTSQASKAEQAGVTSSPPPVSNTATLSPQASPAGAAHTPPSPFLAAAGFPSPFGGFVRNPFPPSSQQSLLMSHGMNPFFPPGILIPGLSNPFQRSTGASGGMSAPTFDPSKHPLTRMPDSSLLKRSSPLNFFDNETGPEKKMRLQTSMRMLKDEPVPEGYMRFRFNEDCGFTCCNYREHQVGLHLNVSISITIVSQ